MPLPKLKLHEMARLLCGKTELESEQSIKLKQKIAEAIKKTVTRNFKLYELLTEALTVLKGEKYIKARREIYDLFEAVSRHEEAQAFIQMEGIRTSRAFREWSRSERRPKNFPARPDLFYKKIWEGWGSFLGI